MRLSRIQYSSSNQATINLLFRPFMVSNAWKKVFQVTLSKIVLTGKSRLLNSIGFTIWKGFCLNCSNTGIASGVYPAVGMRGYSTQIFITPIFRKFPKSKEEPSETLLRLSSLITRESRQLTFSLGLLTPHALIDSFIQNDKIFNHKGSELRSCLSLYTFSISSISFTMNLKAGLREGSRWVHSINSLMIALLG